MKNLEYSRVKKGYEPLKHRTSLLILRASAMLHLRGTVHRPDRISGKLYDALVENRSKALLFCCTTCQRKGSIVNQLYKLRSDVTVADGQRLASAHLVDEAREIVRGLRADKEHLQAEVEALHGLLNKSNKRKVEQITARVSKLELTSAKTTAKDETEVMPKDADTHADVSAELLEESSSLSSTEDDYLPPLVQLIPRDLRSCHLESINLV